MNQQQTDSHSAVLAGPCSESSAVSVLQGVFHSESSARYSTAAQKLSGEE